MYLYAIFGFLTNVFLNVKCSLYAKAKLIKMHQLTFYKALAIDLQPELCSTQCVHKLH